MLIHRFPSLMTSVLSSVAFSLLVVSGSTCSFLTFSGYDNESGQDFMQETGIFCTNDLYINISNDSFFHISRIFMIISLILASITTILSLALTTIVPPTDRNWKILSLIAAITAVFQVPIFLIYEADPCTNNGNCSISISSGTFLLAVSIALFVSITLVTQLLDPPEWADELAVWKLETHSQHNNNSGHNNDDIENRLLMSPQQKKKFFQRWLQKRRWAFGRLSPTSSKQESNNDEMVDALNQYPEAASYYANSDNSRLILKVTPDGKRPGDDTKSVVSFCDLDDDVRLAEEGRMGSISPTPSSSRDSSGDGSNMEEKSSLLGEKLIRDDHAVVTANESMEKEAAKGATKDEPQIYSNPSAFKCSSKGSFLTEKVPPPSNEEDFTMIDASSGKISLGIKALTIRIRRDASHRTKNGKMYTMMDDDCFEDEGFASPLSSDGEMGDFEDTEDISGEDSSFSDMNDAAKIKLMKNWNNMFAATSSGVAIAGGDISSSEDDPELSYYSCSADTEEDVSESSENYKNNVRTSLRRQLRKRRNRDNQGLGVFRSSLSCGNSVSSRTSLLDMTIDEETEKDLQQCKSSSDEEYSESHQILRSKSAPEFSDVIIDSDKSLSPFNQLQIKERSNGSPSPPLVTDTDESSTEGLTSATTKSEGHTHTVVSEDDAESPNGLRRSKSFGQCPRNSRRKLRKIRPNFREESIYRDGIHSKLIKVVSDVSSEEEDAIYNSIEKRARKARLERLQKEKEVTTKRRRTRKQKPSIKRSRSLESYDVCQRIVIGQMTTSRDYGSDEASL